MLSNVHRSVNGKQVPFCSLRVNKRKPFSFKAGKADLKLRICCRSMIYWGLYRMAQSKRRGVHFHYDRVLVHPYY